MDRLVTSSGFEEHRSMSAAGERPTFSVIINNYNYARYLPAAVASITAQTISDYELIIVDDGSDDGSLDYVASLESGIRLVKTARLGQARACLAAVKQARGSYIYFLDADDMASPDLLETAARHLTDRPVKVQFQLVPVNANGEPFAPPYPELSAKHDNAVQLRNIRRTGMPTSPPTSGNIFRRDIFDAIGDIPYERAIDGIALLFAPFIGRIVSIPNGLGFYRVHDLAYSVHASPLDANRIGRERQCFADRLDHLNRLLQHHLPTEQAVTSGRQHFFFWDYLILERVARGQSVGITAIARCLALLLKEYGLTRFSARKLAWLAAALLGSRRLKLRLLEQRLNPWPRRSAAG